MMTWYLSCLSTETVSIAEPDIELFSSTTQKDVIFNFFKIIGFLSREDKFLPGNLGLKEMSELINWMNKSDFT